jgi:hypothetical protein
MKLKELSLQDCEKVRIWRNECLEALRTPFLLTKEMQEQFYREVVCNRDAQARYFGVWAYKGGCTINVNFTECEACAIDGCSIKEKENLILIGMIGIENIEWENHRGEISIIMNPEFRGKGHGEKAVELLLDQGFNHLNLENIWGECYENNPALDFWMKIIEKHSPCKNAIWLACTKYYEGKYWDSIWFNFEKDEWLRSKRNGLRTDLMVNDEFNEEDKNNVKNNT